MVNWDRRARRTGGANDPKHPAGSKGAGRHWAGRPPPGPEAVADNDDGAGAEEGTNDVMAVVARVCAARDELGLQGDIIPFGSHVNGFSTVSSDCDLSYMPPEGSSTETPVRVLQRFANELPRHGFTCIVTIFQALIPLIKAVDPSGIEVDLCVGNHLGHHNSRLIAAYCTLDPRVGEVGRHVKQWAKAWDLVGSSDGHLNSYAYTLLTIYHLMHTRPPVVPNLQDLASQMCDPVIVRDRRWGREISWDCKFWSDIHVIHRSQNTESVEALLCGFFEFYTTTFDWASHAISVRTALTQGPTSKFGLATPAPKDQWYVEDPFDLRHNLASQCSREGRQRILEKMSHTLKVLKNCTGDLLGCLAGHCTRSQQSYMLKCRVHTEKVSSSDFVRAFDCLCNMESFVVWFPSTPQGGRSREVMDAFLVFRSEADRRRVHRLNETYVREWQLRLLPCSTWALEDARVDRGGYEELEVTPRGAQADAEAPATVAAEEVRRGLAVAQTAQEVRVLIERAQAMDLTHEEMLGRKKLKEIQKLAGTAAEELPPPEFRFQ